jgi:twitching motility two-component system response regulator PilG
MVTPLSRSLRDGMAAALARDFEAAYPLLQQATTESPADIDAWLWRAVASSSPADAVSCLRRVLVFEPSHVQAQHALARLLVAQASAAAGNGQQPQALALAREAVGLAPDCDAAWVGLASFSSDPDERIDALRRANDLSPHVTKTRLLLRDALLLSGVTAAAANPDRARERFREAATIDPTDPRVWQALARVARSAGESLEALRELARLAPDRPGVRAVLKKALVVDAESLAASGAAADAAARWREAAALDSSDPAAWLGLAGTTTDGDEARRALDEARRAGGTDPRHAALSAQPAAGSVEPAAGFEQPAAGFEKPVETAPIALERTPLEVQPPAASLPPAPRPVVADFAPRPPAIAATAAPTLGGNGSADASAPAGSGRTVMIVDDSPTVRKILAMTLERAGYGVLSAADGEAALTALDDTLPDLILLDISMPKLDGYEVCKRIRANARTAHVPVVMLSGKDAFFDKVKGRMAGASEYLTKPFATPAVLAVIGRQFEEATGAAHG